MKKCIKCFYMPIISYFFAFVFNYIFFSKYVDIIRSTYFQDSMYWVLFFFFLMPAKSLCRQTFYIDASLTNTGIKRSRVIGVYGVFVLCFDSVHFNKSIEKTLKHKPINYWLLNVLFYSPSWECSLNVAVIFRVFRDFLSPFLRHWLWSRLPCRHSVH